MKPSFLDRRLALPSRVVCPPISLGSVFVYYRICYMCSCCFSDAVLINCLVQDSSFYTFYRFYVTERESILTSMHFPLASKSSVGSLRKKKLIGKLAASNPSPSYSIEHRSPLCFISLLHWRYWKTDERKRADPLLFIYPLFLIFFLLSECG